LKLSTCTENQRRDCLSAIEPENVTQCTKSLKGWKTKDLTGMTTTSKATIELKDIAFIEKKLKHLSKLSLAGPDRKTKQY
jgi:hypothetical protein